MNNQVALDRCDKLIAKGEEVHNTQNVIEFRRYVNLLHLLRMIITMSCFFMRYAWSRQCLYATIRSEGEDANPYDVLEGLAVLQAVRRRYRQLLSM